MKLCFLKNGARKEAAGCEAWEEFIRNSVAVLDWEMLLDFGPFALPWA